MFAEVRRRRVLRALALYVVGSWALIQVADATFEPLGIPLWVQKALIVTLIVGIVPAAILAWVYDLTRHGIARTAALPAPDAAPRGALAGPTHEMSPWAGAAVHGDGAGAPAADAGP